MVVPRQPTYWKHLVAFLLFTMMISSGFVRAAGRNQSVAIIPLLKGWRSRHDVAEDSKKPQAISLEKTRRRSLSRGLQRTASGVISGIGFLSSAATDLLTDRSSFRQRWQPSVDAMKNFLQKSGIDLEISNSLNIRLLDRVVILARVQSQLIGSADRRDLALAPGVKRPSNEESLRYMRYATAVYGDSMISAAEMDVLGTMNTRVAPATKTRISEHIDVPEEDIVLVDVDYAGDPNHLRHFVAVDHANEKVVLAIRGTFNLGEIFVDVAAFSRPYCGGEAHSEMANMAERIWEVAGGTVNHFLRENKGYELILTGHSLGGGAACLLNILCHSRGRALVDGRPVRCFTYAAPPVFCPLELAHGAVQSCTNHIHSNDVVPFLSVDSVRHLFSSVRVIEEGKLGFWKRMKILSGTVEPDEEIQKEVERASQKRLPPKAGAPILAVPAKATVWMKETETGTFDIKVCDARKLANMGITIHPDMIQDHFPSRYEHALHNLE
jgi:hypothetical protein